MSDLTGFDAFENVFERFIVATNEIAAKNQQIVKLQDRVFALETELRQLKGN